MAPRALPWATDLLGFQPAQGRPYVPKRKKSINSPLLAQRPFQGQSPALERPGNSLIRLIRCYAV